MSGGGSGTDTNSRPVHPMDAKFASLMLSHIAPVDPTGQEHAAIAAYARDTELRASTFALDVQTVFRVERWVSFSSSM
jgi:hypothetical protein